MSVIDSSILDIGSSKWSQQVDDITMSMSMANSQFMLPAVANPAEYARTHFSAEKGQDYDQDIKFMKGTTTLAFKVKSCVCVPDSLYG
jgi:20S proteasome subunit beta 5